jgi:hypothetical protein
MILLLYSMPSVISLMYPDPLPAAIAVKGFWAGRGIVVPNTKLVPTTRQPTNQPF